MYLRTENTVWLSSQDLHPVFVMVSHKILVSNWKSENKKSGPLYQQLKKLAYFESY